MAVYYLNLFLILALAYPLCIYKPSKAKKAAYIVITLAYMWVISTFRYGIGFDFYTYVELFRRIRETDGFSALMALPWEPGYVLVTKLMTLFINDQVVMYGVYQAMVLLPMGWFVYKYCKDAWLSMWLFVTLTFFYISMNFTRQSIACSIIVLGYRFLRDRKAVPFLLIVLLAASFHKTALIMIPVYFICHFALNKKWLIIYGSATLLFFLFAEFVFDFVTNYIFTYYKDSLWSQPFPIIYLIVPFIVFGACLALWFAWRKRYSEADMLLNLMLYSAVIWLFITRMFILERFSMYMYVFVMIALPQAISCLKCGPEDYEKLEEMKQALDGAGKRNGKPGKQEQAAVKALSLKISDHRKYYISAVIAVLLVTGVYHEFGAYASGGFHAVFPYNSEFEALNRPDWDGNGVTVPEGWSDMRGE